MLDFENYPIIAAVRGEEDFEEALCADVQTIFLLGSSIFSIDRLVERAHECGKLIFLHMDFVQGISNDVSGVKYLATKGIDMVEILPGIAYKSIEKIKHNVRIPIIAGGLIDHKEEVFKALSLGASAISTGKKELWEQ